MRKPKQCPSHLLAQGQSGLVAMTSLALTTGGCRRCPVAQRKALVAGCTSGSKARRAGHLIDGTPLGEAASQHSTPSEESALKVKVDGACGMTR
eukprot:2613612-Pleurochrysis_carterae.AAC.4